MLVLIYLRVSTEEQARKGFSLPSQREACLTRARAIAAEAGAACEVKEFVDTFGGDVLERPVLEELRAYVRTCQPDWFICMDPDRFSRNLTAQLLITDEIERAGTRLAFVQHNYEKTAEGRLFYQLRGAVAEFEKAKILERTTRGKRRKLQEGGRSNGAAPYGYRHNRLTDELEVFEPEAEWVRLIFGWVAREHLTYYQVVRRLRELGVTTKRGGIWREGSVAYMLRNTTYVGRMVCNRYDWVGKSAFRRLPRTKRGAMTHQVRPETDWTIAPVPAIVDQATFDSVQRILGAAVRRGGARPGYLLSMLLRCGRCGASMAYNRKQSGRYLRCNRRFADLRHYADPTRCDMPHMRAEALEAGVWQAVCGWLLEPSLVAALSQQPDHTERLAAEIAALEKQMAQKHAEQRVIIQKQARRLLPEAAADAMLSAARSQIGHLEARLQALRSQPLQTGAAAALPDTKTLLARLTEPQRAQLVRQIVRTVTVHGEGSWTITPY